MTIGRHVVGVKRAPKDGTNAWDYRKETCVAMIDSIYPDVLGMQEVTPQVMSKGWDAAFERVATYVVLKNKKTGEKMIVFNTHLDHVGGLAREMSMRMMADTLKALGGNKMPMFLMGDLNVFPDDSSIAPVYDYMQWSQRQAQQTTSECTFTGFNNKDNHIIVDW